MAQVIFKGKNLKLQGKELKVGDALPDFTLTGQDLSDICRDDFLGGVIVLSVVPSMDTKVCSIQTKRFNFEAASLSPDVRILSVSLDLPFALKRWCGAEGVERVIVASDHKFRTFGPAFGVYIAELGLLSRAVFVSDPSGRLTHVEYVTDVSQEPDYAMAMEAVKDALKKSESSS